MPIIDTEDTDRVLRAFQSAWSWSISDYEQRRINSEHTLQSSIYHYLRASLPENYDVYTEAVIRLSEAATEMQSKRKVVVDLLVCLEREIIAAIELKYTPRGAPTLESLKKDVRSLSCITNRRNLENRVAIEMPRFRSSDGDSLRLSISRHRKLILAAYFNGRENCALSEGSFWRELRPEAGEYWSNFGHSPKDLGVALARTDDSGRADPCYFGGPFERLKRDDALPSAQVPSNDCKGRL